MCVRACGRGYGHVAAGMYVHVRRCLVRGLSAACDVLRMDIGTYRTRAQLQHHCGNTCLHVRVFLRLCRCKRVWRMA